MATSIKIDDELKNRIQHLAGLRQRSSHWIMREAIAQYVEREEARESFKAGSFGVVGGVSGNRSASDRPKTRAWLNTWGTEAEAELPKCHE